jgi:hypothetical protein
MAKEFNPKKFSWVKDVILISGGYGKNTVVAIRGEPIMEVKIKMIAKSGTFTCDELALVETTHDALIDKIYEKAINEKERQDYLTANPHIGLFDW